jgi:hypothetical protein
MVDKAQGRGHGGQADRAGQSDRLSAHGRLVDEGFGQGAEAPRGSAWVSCKSSLTLTYHKTRLNSTSVWDCSVVRSDSASIR